MKKSILVILTMLIILSFSACGKGEMAAKISSPTSEPSPTKELATPRPSAPMPSPRSAEEVLPPIEKDIFDESSYDVYNSTFSVSPDKLAVILADGSVVFTGMYGLGAAEPLGDSDFFKLIKPTTAVKFICSAQFDNFLIDEENTLWGSGLMTSWGNIIGAKPSNPSPNALLTDVQMASTGVGSYLALRRDGKLWAWGSNEYGQLGVSNKDMDYSTIYPLHEPILVLDNCIFARHTGANVYAIREDNSLWVWGLWGHDEKTGEFLSFEKPTKIMENVKYANGELVIKTDNTLWEMDTNWRNLFDKAGNRLSDEIKACQIEADVKLSGRGFYFYRENLRTSYMIKNDGSLWLWVDTYLGETRDKSLIGTMEPVKVMDNVHQLEVGEFWLYALKTNGELWKIGADYEIFGADRKKPVTQEEFSNNLILEKVIDGVLVRHG